ncbi:MAG TPA: hypothetical protein VMV84_01640 [Dehalococcoidales bacterium]|nr:hypothetical protein [Dehalococcoidales bacterium]
MSEPRITRKPYFMSEPIKQRNPQKVSEPEYMRKPIYQSEPNKKRKPQERSVK